MAAGGISYAYVKEVLGDKECKLLKISTPNPFPEKLALEFLEGLEEVLVLEELDPVIERELVYLCGKHHLKVNIRGKLTGDTRQAGENSVESVKKDLAAFLGWPPEEKSDCPRRPLCLYGRQYCVPDALTEPLSTR